MLTRLLLDFTIGFVIAVVCYLFFINNPVRYFKSAKEIRILYAEELMGKEQPDKARKILQPIGKKQASIIFDKINQRKDGGKSNER